MACKGSAVRIRYAPPFFQQEWPLQDHLRWSFFCPRNANRPLGSVKQVAVSEAKKPRFRPYWPEKARLLAGRLSTFSGKRNDVFPPPPSQQFRPSAIAR